METRIEVPIGTVIIDTHEHPETVRNIGAQIIKDAGNIPMAIKAKIVNYIMAGLADVVYADESVYQRADGSVYIRRAV